MGEVADREFLDLATKLTILCSLSALSSALMSVCVVIVGFLSRDMTDTLMFWWFSGESIDVAGNCLAMFLTIKMNAAPYRFLCGAMHSCCQRMVAPKKEKQKTAAPTKVELVIAASIAADAVETAETAVA